MTVPPDQPPYVPSPMTIKGCAVVIILCLLAFVVLWFLRDFIPMG